MIEVCPLCTFPYIVREVLEGAADNGGPLYHYLCPKCGLDCTIESESPQAIKEMAQTLEEFMTEFRSR